MSIKWLMLEAFMKKNIKGKNKKRFIFRKNSIHSVTFNRLEINPESFGFETVMDKGNFK